MVDVYLPLFEELLFRGLLLRWLGQHFSTTGAVIVSAAVFAVMHGYPIVLPYAFVAGLFLGLIRERTGSTLKRSSCMFSTTCSFSVLGCGFLGNRGGRCPVRQRIQTPRANVSGNWSGHPLFFLVTGGLFAVARRTYALLHPSQATPRFAVAAAMDAGFAQHKALTLLHILRASLLMSLMPR
jgi:Type II CAAX prenyl endopeptidase Rce1-like